MRAVMRAMSSQTSQTISAAPFPLSISVDLDLNRTMSLWSALQSLK